MSSLKSLAAAKNRRSNEPPHITSGVRPGTSIASHAAFAQQQQYQGIPGRNGMSQSSRFQEQQMPPSQAQTNGLPFSKLTVSDAIGLITLRLGKVEQFLIDFQHEGLGNSGEPNIPENTKLIDNSVLTSMIHRLDSLEKRDNSASSNDAVAKLEKEVKEIKELLLNLMFKYELFVKETNATLAQHEAKFLENDTKFSENEVRFLENDTKFSENEVRFLENNNKFLENEAKFLESDAKFADYENIFSEIEYKLSQQHHEEEEQTICEHVEIDDGAHSDNSDSTSENDKILSAELKNIIKQELLSSDSS
jgi:hypothetical protein